jgi:ketosteroid isomerase-like protein
MTEAPRTNGELVRAMFRAVDDADYDAIAALTAKDVHFRFGNAAPTSTQSELLAAARSLHDALADLRHDIHELWEADERTVIALMDVYYKRLDGKELNLPCCNVFRLHDGVVNDYLIYMDFNPVIAP